MLNPSPKCIAAPLMGPMRRMCAMVLSIGLLVSGCGGGADTTVASSAPATSAPEPTLPFGEELQRALMGSPAVTPPRVCHWPWWCPPMHRGSGLRGIRGLPVTNEMAFGAGSISKNFIAALVLQLAEEGKLSLEDQLGEWLPAYPNIDGTATIRQLLSHTSGTFSLNRHPDFWATVFADGTRVWTDDELIAAFQAEPYSTPGTEWHYSNTGYTLLGQIIEGATGSTVFAELRERFFEPLGLDSTFYPPEETAPGEVSEGWFDVGLVAPGVDAQKPALEAFSKFPWTASLPEAGGIFASAEDLAIWAQALFHHKVVLTPDSLDQMLDWVAAEIPAEEAQIISNYGLGAVRFNPDLVDGTTVIGHSGGALFYTALSAYLPDYGVTIGAAQNADTADAFGSMVEEVVALITTHVEPIS